MGRLDSKRDGRYENEMSDAQIADTIDAFIAEPKTLDGQFPPWGGKYGHDFQCRWGILDSLNIRKGELVFAISAKGDRPSVLALFGQHMFYRLDLVPATECEPNPPDAHEYSLAAKVCGPHIHPWPANRGYVIKNGFGRLPYRTAIGGQREMTIEQALAITADELNITVLGVQRDCPLPPQSELFTATDR